MTLKWKSRGGSLISAPMKYSENGGKTWVYYIPESSRQKTKSAYQITGSEGHLKLPNGKWSGGGPFYTGRSFIDFPMRDISWNYPPGGRLVVTRVGTPMPDSLLPVEYRTLDPTTLRSKDTSDLDEYGTEAISRVAPTNPTSNLAQTLAELHREKLPALPGLQSIQKRLAIIRAAGSEFLNVQFGWLPLLGEVENMSNSIRHSDQILRQYLKDAGKLVRREYEFDTEISESEKTIKGGAGPSCIHTGATGFPGWCSSLVEPQDLTQSIKVTTKRHFSGAFTYPPPGNADNVSKALGFGSEANKLLGTSVTPDVLWELTPWSWLVDWFTNTGEIINNFTQFETQGLVMPYGYIMEEKSVEITHKLVPTAAQKKEPQWYLMSVPPSRKTFVTKVRRPANPFGFGIEWPDLSPVQIAILIALGITLP